MGPIIWGRGRVLWNRHVHGNTPAPKLVEHMENQRVLAPQLGLGSAIDMLIVSQIKARPVLRLKA